jgi:hypothetical protein
LAKDFYIEDEVYHMLKMLVEPIIQLLPAILESYLGHIFFNPAIWACASSEIQNTVVLKIRSLIEADTKIEFVDLLMQNIEYLSSTNQVSSILKIIELISFLGNRKLNEAMIRKISSCANIYYMRSKRHYLVQLYYVLKILLQLYTQGNAFN